MNSAKIKHHKKRFLVFAIKWTFLFLIIIISFNLLIKFNSKLFLMLEAWLEA